MALSENFKREVERREKPKCYGNFKIESAKGDAGRKKCGMCWFNPYCSGAEKLPVGKATAKAPVKES